MEVCSLPTFTKGIKKKHYDSAALVMVSRDTPKTNATEDLSDKYVRQDDHGSYEAEAKKTLEDL